MLVGWSDSQAVVDEKTSRPSNHKTKKPTDQPTNRLPDQPTTRPTDYPTNRLPDHKTPRNTQDGPRTPLKVPHLWQNVRAGRH
ncbi:MAG: PT domain-containing protein [Anaerolineales bacterium]|nr:PT domain-containing protein [Anaerolineales bacterium]